MTKTEFRKLLGFLSEARLRKSTRGSTGLLIASESDKGRVINSAAFRRLQQKAQVFPLDPNAAVRTRLTHSIEVSQVGRHLAQKVIQSSAKGYDGDYGTLAALVNTVETACLLHDIGNPPFGHFGEIAIREWFGKKGLKIPDLLHFDGNPQGFRLISFLSGADAFGLNLTCSLMLSTVKYPCTLASKKNYKKVGLYNSDYGSYLNACNALGWTPGRRFPLVLLMDAADDIAYSTSDLEDGLEKKIVSLDDLRTIFGSARFNSAQIDPFIFFKTNVINEAVDVASRTFVRNIGPILAGEDVDLIGEKTEISRILAKIGTFTRERIYTHESAERVELAGRSVIRGLLDHLEPLFGVSGRDFPHLMNENRDHLRGRGLEVQERLARRLPVAYRKRKYNVIARGSETLRRAHLIVDYISGMTDDFALDTYQILEGIKIQ